LYIRKGINYQRLLASSILIVALLLGSVPAAQAQSRVRYFDQTGHNVSGRFLDYWEQHGGLVQQGYPLSELVSETSEVDGRNYNVQYFERAALEAHPENTAPNDILLTQLGRLRLATRYPQANPTSEAAPSSDPAYFAATRHAIDGRFFDYWQKHGGLVQQGYPLTEAFIENSELDGNPYVVQYFERAVFEYHPENAAPNDILLSQLGRLRYVVKYGPVNRAAPISSQPAQAGAANVVIVQYDHYVSSIGILRFVGLLRNTGGTTASGIGIALTLFDASGKVSGTGSDYSQLGRILTPGESIGFFIDVLGPPSTWAREDLKLTAQNYNPAAAFIFKPTSNFSVSADSLGLGILGDQLVRGLVRNNEAVEAKFVAVLATGYDAAGKVVDVNFAFTNPGTVPAGGDASFTVAFPRLDRQIVRYELVVGGQL